MRKSILIALLIGITIAIISLANIKRKEEPIDEVQEKGIAIMVYDESKKTYVKSDTFPVGRYELSTSSYCTNGTPIGTYDSETGTMTTILKKSDKCYYYFDTGPITIILSVKGSTSTKNYRVGSKYSDLPSTVDFSQANCYFTGVPAEWYDVSDITKADSYNKYTTDTIVSELDDGKVLYAIYDLDKSGCFAKDTMIYTLNGYKAIQNIKVGDKVYSYNEETKNVESDVVSQTFKHTIYEIIDVLLEDGTKIKVTPNHPIYDQKTSSWKPIGEFEKGDYLTTDKNESIKIVSVNLIKEENIVYNIEVEKNHNYFVTKSNIMVHNKEVICD